jgi:uncharacterized membrane protein YoaK (UPF0700 family)
MAIASSSPVDFRAPPAVPVLLAFVAGGVDACTFLGLFGLFVAQLTGSFVTVGVELVRHGPAPLIQVLALPLFFVAGAAIVFLIYSVPARGLALPLAIETLFLAGFMTTGLVAAPFADANRPAAVLAGVLGLLTMGVQSATVRLALPGVASTNVMTINTSQLAIDVAQWLIATFRASDSHSRAAASRRIAALAPIMAGFFVGSVLGAIGFTHVGFWSLLPLIGILLALAGWVHRAVPSASGRRVG